ncbi:MAG: acyltransferase family protein [Lachnospiraceae bacterium]|nr:acyltransferase family protein [Lachnospiraceae bacterium]
MKFVACFFIMIFHLDNTFNGIFSQYVPFFQKYGGYLGNYIFFILSGFCMDYSYHYKLIHEKCSFKKFLFPKLLKIYPVYFLSLFFFVCVSGLSSVNMKKLILSFAMISSGWVDDIYPDNAVAWFFSIILLLYIIYYFVCFLQSRTDINIYLPIFIILAFVGYALYSLKLSYPFMYVHDGEGLLYFSIGICLSNFMRNYPLKIVKSISYLGLFILFIYSFLCIKYDAETVSGDVGLICGVMISTIIVIWFLNTSFMPWLFQKLAYFGKISMEMCLLHLPLNYIFYNSDLPLENNSAIWFVMYFIILVCICSVCHVLTVKLRAYRIL